MFTKESITKGGGKSAVAKQAAYARHLARSKGKTKKGEVVPPLPRDETGIVTGPGTKATVASSSSEPSPSGDSSSFNKKTWNARSQRVR